MLYTRYESNETTLVTDLVETNIKMNTLLNCITTFAEQGLIAEEDARTIKESVCGVAVSDSAKKM